MEGNQIKEGGTGPMIGVIIILLVIVLGGLYFWKDREANEDRNEDQTATSTSQTDDTTSIQSDLNNTNIDSADYGL